MDIRAHAEKVAAEIEKILRSEGAPDAIVIASYASREDYAELNRDPSEMSYDEHMQTVKLIAERLAAAKLANRVIFQDIESGEYWRWLAKNNLPDNRSVRGLFADLKYHGGLDKEIDLSKLRKK